MSTINTTSNAAVAEEKKEVDFSLTDLLGKTAVMPSGESISIDSEWGNGKKDTIAFYFSAHWCPPCRKFTPKLAKAYQEYREKNPNDNFELVFVSADSDEESFKEYHGEMTFPALDYKESRGAIQEKLDEKFGVRGIPALAVMDARTGGRLDFFVDEDEEDGSDEKVSPEKKWKMSPRDMVQYCGGGAFPLSKASSEKCVDMGKQKQERALEQVMALQNVILPLEGEGSGDTYTFAKLLDTYKYVGIMLGSKGSLERLPAIAKVIKEVNKEDNKSLAVVYVPDCFTEFDQYYDQPYKEENVKEVFHFQEKPSQETIDLLKGTAGQVRMDTLVIVQQTTKKVEECGMDGNCTSKDVKSIELVATDGFAESCTRHGATFLPWSKAKVDQAVAEEKSRAMETKAKMEASMESFLLDLAAEGNILIGDKADATAVADRLKELDDEEGLIAVLHHERPSFLPKLVDVFEEVNKTPTKGGKKKLEVVFAGSNEDEQSDFDKTYAKMLTKTSKTQFMAIAFPELYLRRSIRGAYIQERFDPTCVILMKKDGTLVSSSDEIADAISNTAHWGFPWNEEGISKGEEKMKALAKEEDERCEKVQLEMGVPIVRRLIGPGREVRFSPEERTVRAERAGFLTYGMQDTVVVPDTESKYDACTDAGLFYYEIEILKVGQWAGATQLGFSAPGAMDEFLGEDRSCSGCGDATNTWGVCGLRGELWTGGSSLTWFDPEEEKEGSLLSKWKDGDVVGLAVNVQVGKIAVSVNGGDFAVVFQDEEAMKAKGVFPCFSFDDDVEIRINTTRATFKHSGPSAEAWLLEPPKKEETKDE